ncbi:MAG: aspartate--tRNA ligase [Candidatus Moraniibacteriota bacterium]
MLRTHTCGELNEKNKEKKVTLSGWVHRRRDHGGVIFIDLRDRYGLTQIKFDPDKNKKAWKKADELRNEWVIQVEGVVVERPSDMVNEKMKTGKIEIEVQRLEIFSKSKTPPFELEEEKNIDVREEKRMEYRYVDLRRKENLEILKKRHYFVKLLKDYLSGKGFLEIETPYLGKSTPEGARDFLVPSRLHPGEFYALVQSPQQYKQFLMIAGVDKYFQLAKCFRDEDTRGDRQAEFTQLDIEQSFVEREDILELTEEMFTDVIEAVFPEKEIMFKPWKRLSYDEAMLKYGTDRPDLRFGLEIQDLTDDVKGCGFKVFSDAAEKNEGVVRAICAKGGAKFSRGDIDHMTEFVKYYGAKGLAYIVVKENGELQSPIVKFLGEDLAAEIVEKMEAEAGDIIFFGADNKEVVCEALGELRTELAKRLNLIDENKLALVFVIDFPLFVMEHGQLAPSHHMFTAPIAGDEKLLDTEPEKARCQQYDFVANGCEVAGGSIRIHNRKIQEKVFDIIGFDENKKKQFNHFLKAFEYGVPPHGGIAPGIDRLLMILLGKSSIRDVIAFPKTGDGRDLTMNAPSEINKKQLEELGIKVEK